MKMKRAVIKYSLASVAEDCGTSPTWNQALISHPSRDPLNLMPLLLAMGCAEMSWGVGLETNPATQSACEPLF